MIGDMVQAAELRERYGMIEGKVQIQTEEQRESWETGRVVEVYQDRADEWRWRRVVKRGGKTVADGSEGYRRPSGAEKAALRENPGIEVTRA